MTRVEISASDVGEDLPDPVPGTPSTEGTPIRPARWAARLGPILSRGRLSPAPNATGRQARGRVSLDLRTLASGVVEQRPVSDEGFVDLAPERGVTAALARFEWERGGLGLAADDGRLFQRGAQGRDQVQAWPQVRGRGRILRARASASASHGVDRHECLRCEGIPRTALRRRRGVETARIHGPGSSILGSGSTTAARHDISRAHDMS